MSRYSQTLVDHATSPRNLGPLESCSARGQMSFNGQPPFVTFYVRLIGAQLEEVRYEAQGCGVTIAACSVLSILATGISLTEAQAIPLERLVAELDGVPPDKMHSPEVALAAFKEALANLPN